MPFVLLVAQYPGVLTYCLFYGEPGLDLGLPKPSRGWLGFQKELFVLTLGQSRPESASAITRRALRRASSPCFECPMPETKPVAPALFAPPSTPNAPALLSLLEPARREPRPLVKTGSLESLCCSATCRKRDRRESDAGQKCRHLHGISLREHRQKNYVTSQGHIIFFGPSVHTALYPPQTFALGKST